MDSWGWTSSDGWNWLNKKIVMKMDETQQCKWNCEIKGHKLKVNDISEGYHMAPIGHPIIVSHHFLALYELCQSIW